MNNGASNLSREQLEKAQRVAHLIAAYIKGDIGPKEHDELDEWVAESDENMLLFEELTDEKNVTMAMEWARNLDTEASLRKAHEKMQQKAEKKIQRRALFYAAAAFAVGIAVIVFFLYQQKKIDAPTEIAKTDIPPGGNHAVLRLADNTVILLDTAKDGSIFSDNKNMVTKKGDELAYANTQGGDMGYNTLMTPRGGQFRILLPDGTRAWLNAASSIRYPVSFRKQRKVEVTGEAYFEVAKDSSRPFQVGIGVNTVEVLGTHFNINSYDDENDIATTLLEGSVKLISNKKENILRPGQQALIDKKGEVKIMDAANANETIAWKNGLFVFRGSTIEPLMRQVARWYDVTVKYEGSISYHFNATIQRNENISKLLGLLEATGNVHFSIEGKTITVKP